MKYTTKFTLLISIALALIAGLLTKALFPETIIPHLNNIGAIAIGFMVFLLHFLFTGGSLSPFVFRENLTRIGLANKNGKPPIFLGVKADGTTSHGFIITLLNRGISVDDFEKARENIESSFNIIVDKIRYAEGSRRITKIYAVPASCDLPQFIPWDDKYLSSNRTKVVLGQGLTSLIYWDYVQQPHALIASTTGGGKSTLLRLIICSLLKHGRHHAIHILDLKGVDFTGRLFRERTNVIFDVDKFLSLLREMTKEMHTRLEELHRTEQKNIDQYNANIHETWKHIFIFIDEASELFSLKDDPDSKAKVKEILHLLSSILRLGRAAGLHTVLGSQHPTVDTIPGVLRSCIDAKICGKVTGDTESIIVLGNANSVRRIPDPIPGRFLFNDTLFQSFYFDESLLGEYRE